MCPLFLKDKCVSSLVRTKYIEKKSYSCFFFPLFHKHLFSPGLRHATDVLETSCLEKITVCVIETMLVTLPLVQMNKARREVNRTNQVQTKINIVKGLQTSVIHLIPGSTCHWISNRMRYFLKNIFWSKHFPATTNCKTWHSRVFLVKPVFYFINFPHEHYQYVSSNLELCLKKQFYRDVFLGNLRNFSNIYSQKLHILLCFFITDFANFIYSSPNLWN